MTELQTALEKAMAADDINLFFKELYEASLLLVRIKDEEAGDMPIFLSENFDGEGEEAPPYMTVAESKQALGDLTENADLVFSEISGAHLLDIAARHGLEIVLQFEDDNLYCVDRDHIEYWQEKTPDAFEIEPQTAIAEEFIVALHDDGEDEDDSDEDEEAEEE